MAKNWLIGVIFKKQICKNLNLVLTTSELMVLPAMKQ